MNSEFRGLWKAAGYHDGCGSAAVVPPPPPHLIRVYHLTSAEHAISNIGLGRLKVSTFSDLNDPFELLAANFRTKPVREVVRAFKKDYSSHTGLLCFSSDWLNPVLWSHYASKHKGICLGFDLDRRLSKIVNYEKDRPELPIKAGNQPIDDSLRDLLLCTKYKHWEYEGEIRAFVKLKSAIQEGGLYFYPFGTDLRLKEVIVGSECPISLESVRMLTSQKYPDAITFKARLALKWFSVVPKESTVP